MSMARELGRVASQLDVALAADVARDADGTLPVDGNAVGGRAREVQLLVLQLRRDDHVALREVKPPAGRVVGARVRAGPAARNLDLHLVGRKVARLPTG